MTPDALTLAKGLAAGLPIGAVVASPRLTDALALGDLGSTFGGGPVPCAAALANLDVIERDGLIANAVAVGEHLTRGARGARRAQGVRAAGSCSGSSSTGRRPRCSGRSSGGGS